MNEEFKKLSQGDVTRYVLESATSIGSSSIASMPMPVGGTRKRGDNLITQEADKKTVPASTPRNFVAKNAKTAGAGAHKDKSKTIPRKEKHKKPYMEALQARLDQLKSKVAEADSPAQLDEFLPALAAGALARGAAAAGGAAIKGAQAVGGAIKQGVQSLAPRVASGAQAAGRAISKVPAAAEKKVIQGAEVLNALVPGGIFNPDGSVKGSQYLTKYLTPQQIQQAQQQGVTEGSEQQFMIYFVVPEHDDYPDRREPTERTIVDANSPGEAARKFKAETPEAYIKDIVAMKQGVAEEFNGEYDDEAGMAQSNLLTTARAVMGLLKTIKDRDNLPEWGQEKIAKAEMMLVSVWDYLQSQKAMGNDPQQGVAEGDYADGSSIKTPGSEDWKQQYQQAVMAVKNAKTQQEYEAASDRAGRIKDLLASKGIQVGAVLGQQGVAQATTKIAKKGMEEDMSRRGFLKGAGAMAAGISAAGGAHADEKSDPNKLIVIVNIDGESKEFNLTGKFKGDVKSQLHQAEDFITEFLEKRDINFSNLELRYQGAVLKTQNTGSVREDDSALNAFLSKGGKVQQLPYKKPRKADKTDYGSKHIGGGGDKMKASRTGTAAKTQGSKVVGVGVDTYFESLQSMMERQLEPTMDLDAWNNNFQNADPNKYHQFKNKTPEKKK